MSTHDEPNNEAIITKGEPTASSSLPTLEDIEAMAANDTLETFLSEHAVPELAKESERRELPFASIEPFDRNTFDHSKYCDSLAGRKNNIPVFRNQLRLNSPLIGKLHATTGN